MIEKIAEIVAGHQQTAIVDQTHTAQELRRTEAQRTLQILDGALGEEKGKGQVGRFGVRVLDPAATEVSAIILQSPVPIPTFSTEQTYYGPAVVTREGPMMIAPISRLSRKGAEDLYTQFSITSRDWMVKTSNAGAVEDRPTITLARREPIAGGSSEHQLVPLLEHCSLEDIVEKSIVDAERILKRRIATARVSTQHSVIGRKPVLSRTGVK